MAAAVEYSMEGVVEVEFVPLNRQGVQVLTEMQPSFPQIVADPGTTQVMQVSNEEVTFTFLSGNQMEGLVELCFTNGEKFILRVNMSRNAEVFKGFAASINDENLEFGWIEQEDIEWTSNKKSTRFKKLRRRTNPSVIVHGRSIAATVVLVEFNQGNNSLEWGLRITLTENL